MITCFHRGDGQIVELVHDRVLFPILYLLVRTPNLIKAMVLVRAGQLCASDITISLQGGFSYLGLITDLYYYMIMWQKLHRALYAKGLPDILGTALKDAKRTVRPIYRSDRGPVSDPMLNSNKRIAGEKCR